MEWDEEGEEEVSPWEAQQRQEDNLAYRHHHYHYHHHHELGLKPAATLLGCVFLGVFGGTWLFYILCFRGW